MVSAPSANASRASSTRPPAFARWRGASSRGHPKLDHIRAVLSVGSLELGPSLASPAWAPYVEARDHFRTWATPTTWARLVAASRQLLVTTQAERQAS